MRRDEKLHQFAADPLARQRREAVARDDAGVQPVAVRHAVRIRRLEAEEAQDAQIILGDAAGRIADEADPAFGEIVETADVIVDDAVGRDRQRVDGEVAPLGIDLPVAPERHIGFTAEGLDVLAQGRHLERHPVDHQRDGAVVDAGRHRLDPGGNSAPHHLLGERSGRDVDVAQRHADERIARGAADHPRLLAAAVEEIEHAPHRRSAEPSIVGKPHGDRCRHRSVPGTRRPFSMWAGM